MYTIKEASTRTGVGVPLLRAWERRYGVVAPTRTESGYRLYDDEAILRLTAMRRLVDQGWAPQQAAERIRDADRHELDGIAAPTAAGLASGVAVGSPIPPGDVEAPPLLAGLVTRIVEAARRLDVAELEAALDVAFASVRFETAAEHVLMPALRAIGEAWERAELSVAGEHGASQAVLRRLGMAYEAAGSIDGDRPILVGLGPGAHHEFGAYAFAIAARRAGLPVLYLGPDLPAESWGTAARERDARAAVIAVPRRADAERAAEVLSALRTSRPRMLLAVGGRHAHRAARADGVLELPDSISAAVDRMRAELAR